MTLAADSQLALVGSSATVPRLGLECKSAQ